MVVSKPHMVVGALRSYLNPRASTLVCLTARAIHVLEVLGTKSVSPKMGARFYAPANLWMYKVTIRALTSLLSPCGGGNLHLLPDAEHCS
jgi:hypothetical protein